MINNNYLVIMAGGVGSRFWPMSTKEKPKQFIDITNCGRTLIQQTIDRFKGICEQKNIYIVTSKDYKKYILAQCPDVPENNILLEPCMRNTAPCIAYATYRIAEINPDANIIVSPADHLVSDKVEFQKIINTGLNFTKNNDSILTLGIKPSRPETGYGYIQTLKNPDDYEATEVKEFKEKPNLETAKQYLKEANYLWNSGIFIWSLNTIKDAIENQLPGIAKVFEAGKKVYNTNLEQDFIDENFSKCENISVDYGILEKHNNIHVIASDFGWSDLGTWGSLWENSDKDQKGNTKSSENIKLIESENCIIKLPKDKKVLIQGLEDVIIAEENGVLMICKKSEEQRIKEFQKEL
ncbi:MAG: mannose-1-phosphate guanylyltransferase [Marinifilaceae bacterium]|jgi:mannose-1-phosphate guanylyltransferase|nr:mannose-1-phosphate guanylyltransferase [Marinifilaceae bacterium]